MADATAAQKAEADAAVQKLEAEITALKAQLTPPREDGFAAPAVSVEQIMALLTMFETLLEMWKKWGNK